MSKTKDNGDQVVCQIQKAVAVEGNEVAENLETVSITKADVDRERAARIAYQKQFFDIAVNASSEASLTSEDRALMDALQLRAMETTMADAFDGFHTKHHLLVPPVDPISLIHMTQSLSAFQPLIDSMKVNITGFGQIFVPTLDLENEKDKKTLRSHFEGDLLQVLETDGVMRIRKLFSNKIDFAKSNETDLLDIVLSRVRMMKHASMWDESDEKLAIKTFKIELLDYLKTDGKVEFEKIRDRDFSRRLEALKREKEDELQFLKSFFSNLNPKESWRRIRGKMRTDFESVGAWSLEVVRSEKSRMPRQLGHVPVSMIRLTRLGDPVSSTLPQKINDIEIVEVEQIVKYRRFAQSIGGIGKFVWFKEFGDERIMDQITGRFVGKYIWNRRKSEYEKNFEGFASEEDFKKMNPQFREATELLYYARYNPMGIPYPVPRWMGCHTLARGMMASEMVNAEFFDNNMVPPMAIKVSNGRLTAQTRERLESQLETKKRGRENFWKVITLESESEGRSRVLGNTGMPTIEIQPLAQLIPTDATHQNYDEKGRLKIRSQFRLPPAHVGQESQYTRQSIQASKVAAEEQVFQPEREEDDDSFNKYLMPALRINHWIYKTNSPPVADNQQMSQVLSTLSKAGLITAGEIRPELEQLFNRPLPKLEDRLNKLPIPLVLIEAKGDQAMKLQGSKLDATKPPRQSDGNLENPEDAMGARPDAAGMAIGSSVTKTDEEHADLFIDDLLKDNPAVLVRRPSRKLEIIVKNDDGELTVIPVEMGDL